MSPRFLYVMAPAGSVRTGFERTAVTISGHLRALRFPHLAAMTADLARFMTDNDGKVHQVPYVILVIAVIAIPWSLSSLHTPALASAASTRPHSQSFDHKPQ